MHLTPIAIRKLRRTQRHYMPFIDELLTELYQSDGFDQEDKQNLLAAEDLPILLASSLPPPYRLRCPDSLIQKEVQTRIGQAEDSATGVLEVLSRTARTSTSTTG
jgi:hypothetical protein